MEIEPYSRRHLEAILRLADAGASFRPLLADPERAHRALAAPGSVALVALVDGEPVGFAHAITDGEIQAYLSMLTVGAEHRRRGYARALVEETMRRAGTLRLDLISTPEGEPLYETFPYNRWPGYRLYPEGEPGEQPES